MQITFPKETFSKYFLQDYMGTMQIRILKFNIVQVLYCEKMNVYEICTDTYLDNELPK